MKKKAFAMSFMVLALVVLAACSGLSGNSQEAQQAPTIVPLVEGAGQAQDLQAGQPAAALPQRQPTPTVAPRAISTPLSPAEVGENEVLLRTEFIARPISVHLLPDAGAEVLGQLDAGQLVIITGTSDGWYQIIYGEARNGQAWISQQEAVFAEPTAQPGVAALEATAEAELAPSVDPAQVPAQPASPAGDTSPAAGQGGTVLANALNVRSAAGAGSAILGQLRQGDRVQIIARQEGWLQIAFPAGPDGAAWVSADYVVVDGEPTPVPPAPASSGLPGKLVFQDRNGGDIYIMNADGAGLRKLTSGFEPALSPDGNQVAFTRWGTSPGVYVINVDGSGERFLVGAQRPRSPAWAPDGQPIIFERNTKIIRCYSTPFGCIPEDQIGGAFGGQDCIDTPSGRVCIADFPLIEELQTGLVRYDLTGGAARDLPGSDYARGPSHHPLDDRVLYEDRAGLNTTRDEGNDAPQLVFEQVAYLGPAEYTQDARYIFGSVGSSDNWNVWRWNADGSQPFALTHPPAIRSGPVHSLAPAVSPDGRFIAFLTNRRGPWELWVMNADGSNQRPLAPEALSAIEFDYSFADERMIDWGI